jgi:hypothetical protein
MKIKADSQLGLHIGDLAIMRELLADLKRSIEMEKSVPAKEGDLPTRDGAELFKSISKRLGYNTGSEFYDTKPKRRNPKTYLIQPSVHACAEAINIKENFSCLFLNRISDGEHIYLLGVDCFFMFAKFNQAIRGCFWDRSIRTAFEVGFDLRNDLYYSPAAFPTAFNKIVRLMTFVELGEVEIEIIEAGRNNGKARKAVKITNESDYTVYVVDSSWNKLIVRTDGFPVRGHFRLQPCGEGMRDRKLIWIDAFEKHGYVRKPKAEIINSP